MALTPAMSQIYDFMSGVPTAFFKCRFSAIKILLQLELELIGRGNSDYLWFNAFIPIMVMLTSMHSIIQYFSITNLMQLKIQSLIDNG